MGPLTPQKGIGSKYGHWEGNVKCHDHDTYLWRICDTMSFFLCHAFGSKLSGIRGSVMRKAVSEFRIMLCGETQSLRGIKDETTKES